jgi:hypothetical protein
MCAVWWWDIDQWCASFASTIGIDHQTLVWYDKAERSDVYFQCWDTAGQERYASMTTAFMRRAQGWLHHHSCPCPCPYLVLIVGPCVMPLFM